MLRIVLRSACLAGVLVGAAKATVTVGVGPIALAFHGEWQLSGGRGERIPLEGQPGLPGFRVIGTENDTNHWWVEAPIEPARLYRLDFLYVCHQTSASGAVIAGPTDVNRDFPCDQRGLKEVHFCFRTPDRLTDPRIRLGQWQTNALIDLADPVLTPVQAVHAQFGPFVLGAGEQIDGDRYVFDAPLDGPSANDARPLHSFTARFNTNRWVLTDGKNVVYTHRVGNLKQVSARIAVSCTEPARRGRIIVEVSRDAQNWRELVILDKPGFTEGDLPASLFPAEQIFVRFTGGDGTFMQINHYRYTATLENPVGRITGSSRYVEIRGGDPGLRIELVRLGALRPVENDSATVAITNLGQGPRLTRVVVRSREAVTGEDGAIARTNALLQLDPTGRSVGTPGMASVTDRDVLTSTVVELAPGQTRRARIPLPLVGTQRVTSTLQIAFEQGPPVFEAVWTYEVPFYYTADYGEMLPGSTPQAALWWTDASRKIPRSRPLPRRQGERLHICAARNEFEAAQLVIRPTGDLTGVTVTAGDLWMADGARIPAANISILEVAYVLVTTPTDWLGIADAWPDPLPPLEQPLNVSGGENQPFWVLVRVPADAPAGEYEGPLTIRADGFETTVPLRLTVWDFTLPEKPFTQSGFGLHPAPINTYHRLKDEADQRAVFARYLQCLADHRISPYDPVPFDGISYRFDPGADPPAVSIDFSRFDEAMTEAVEKYHITAFRLNVPGMGWGGGTAFGEGEIAGHGPGTPQYEAMFASTARQLEEHLAARGWLDMAYVYWYDEPEPENYAFVKAGMDRLKRAAPGIRRMLTEQPEEALYWSVNLWCPVSFAWDPIRTSKRRAAGDQFWWYVCTGPKAPYCTLFIDHPATSLRVWLWQTWQRKIEGVLIWDTVYWTTESAYPPETPQNPYEDPMSYVAGSPQGREARWGNGDGRLLYPPRAAAAANSPTPVLAGPVSTIRLEMLREGIEDVDYLHLLRAALNEKRDQLAEEIRLEAEDLLNVPETITRNLMHYTYDPAPIYSRRAAIADMIVRIRRGSP